MPQSVSLRRQFYGRLSVTYLQNHTFKILTHVLILVTEAATKVGI